MSFTSPDFKSYIAPQTDRCAFIMEFLKNHDLSPKVAEIDGKKHIILQFGSAPYDPQFKIKTVIAHYDRVPVSPGANDNSAADWMLMNWAVYLRDFNGVHNVRIIWTDGEELGWDTGVSQQGAFGIAQTFRRLGITDDDVYVFDACGRGEIAVLSKPALPSGAPQKFINDYVSLQNRCQNLLQQSSPSRWMCLPVPYSDNASFIACGIPAVAITLLPAQEATRYARELMADPKLEDQVLNRQASRAQRKAGLVQDFGYKDRLPLTWRMFHTEKDNAASLTPESLVTMSRILENLARNLTAAN